MTLLASENVFAEKMQWHERHNFKNHHLILVSISDQTTPTKWIYARANLQCSTIFHASSLTCEIRWCAEELQTEETHKFTKGNLRELQVSLTGWHFPKCQHAHDVPQFLPLHRCAISIWWPMAQRRCERTKQTNSINPNPHFNTRANSRCSPIHTLLLAYENVLALGSEEM